MNDRGMASMLAHFRRAAGTESDGASDGELLRQYVEAKSESAFTSLIRRHGAMVYSVARRVLRDGHAAEDVFQATFLALARKAKSLRHRDALSGWLYRVALRAALRARPVMTTRPLKTEPTVETPWPELRTVLDEEIDKLPDHCRLAVIACYLRGHSTEEAAQQFGCPRGTVLSRLAAARERLRRGLTKRGYAVSVAGLTAGLSFETNVAVPASLLATTAKLALPGAVIAPIVSTLAQGVLHAMWMTKVKVAVITVAAIGLLGVGTSQYFGPGPAQALGPQFPGQANQKQPPAKVPAQPNTHKEPEDLFVNLEALIELRQGDGEEITLLKERFACAERELKLRMEEYKVGRGTLDILLESMGRLRDASLDLAANKDSRIKMLERYVACSEMVMQQNQQRFDVGAIKEQDLMQTKYAHLEAKLRLLREKGAKGTSR